jgi:hypothetical protein
MTSKIIGPQEAVQGIAPERGSTQYVFCKEEQIDARRRGS